MSLSQDIKKIAAELGFDPVGIISLESLEPGDALVADWVREGKHGTMKYLEDFSNRRQQLMKHVPNAKSVIVLGANYFSSMDLLPSRKSRSMRMDSRFRGNDNSLIGKVAMYAWGKDYHEVLAKRHQIFIERLRDLLSLDFVAKSCVDIQAIPERFAAKEAGLGFRGKHTGLLNEKYGPWLFLSEIVTSLALETDTASEGSCGTCTHCQDVCPTGALNQDYELDARLCIAYLTIEYKGVIPRELRGQVKDWVFGCDECLKICPFTAKSKETTWDEFKPEAGVGPEISLAELFELKSNSEYRERFAGTALMRASRKQLLRNACLVLGNSGDASVVSLLVKGLNDKAPLVRLHAAWALGNFQEEAAESALAERFGVETDAEVLKELVSLGAMRV